MSAPAGHRFAEGTSVSPEKTRAELETVLKRYGASAFRYSTSERRGVVEFFANQRLVKFVLDLPDPADHVFWSHPRYPKSTYRKATVLQAQGRWEAEVRRLWRALLLAVKAKLELVSSGVTVFEQEFMANIVLPDGRTVADHVVPAIADAYASGNVRALLPAGGGQ